MKFEVVPDPTHPMIESCGGAVITCWIDRSTAGEAEAAARFLIEQRGWQIVDFEGMEPRSREEQRVKGPAALCFYDQAVVESEALFEFTWPRDAAE